MIRGIEKIEVYQKNREVEYESHIKKKIRLDEFEFKNENLIDVSCVEMRVKSYNTTLQEYKEFVDILSISRQVNTSNRLVKIVVGNYSVSVTPDHILYVFIKEFPVALTADELSEKLRESMILIPSIYGLVKIDAVESYEYIDYVYSMKLNKNEYVAYNGIIC